MGGVASFLRRPAGDLITGLLAVLVFLGVASFPRDLLLASLVDKDFANYWVAARLALSGQVVDVFNGHDTYFVHMREIFGPDYPWHSWSYPPHYLLFVWPVGMLSYEAGLFVFLAVTLALYLLAARILAGDLKGCALYLGPFVLLNLWAGQNGFLTGALMLGALAFRYKRPVIAGILAGCLTVKPQLGILLPLLLMFEGRWKVIGVAIATAMVLVLLSALAFGMQSWIGYVRNTLPYQGAIMTQGTGIFLDMMPSMFGTLRNLGLQHVFALMLHFLFAAPVLLAALWAFRHGSDARFRAAILVIGTILITPYSLIYDLGAVAAVLMADRLNVSSYDDPVRENTLKLAALIPLVAIPLGLMSLPLVPLIFALAFFVVLGRDYPVSLVERFRLLKGTGLREARVKPAVRSHHKPLTRSPSRASS